MPSKNQDKRAGRWILLIEHKKRPQLTILISVSTIQPEIEQPTSIATHHYSKDQNIMIINLQRMKVQRQKCIYGKIMEQRNVILMLSQKIFHIYESLIIINMQTSTGQILQNKSEQATLVPHQQQPQAPKKKILPSGIPERIINNKILASAISILPNHYNFEIYKTLLRIELLQQQLNKKQLKVSLQFPQGLMLFACIISDILKQFSSADVETVIMGDVTYGACCIDDLASQQMGCDLLVHYGHSCLIPVTQTRKKVLYVFVEIQIDIEHFVETVAYNFEELKEQTLYFLGTIQFNNSLFLAKQKLNQKGFKDIVIPQQKPRSAGEVLGCTSPKLDCKQDKRNIVVFLCDGRFHMQATMIANPKFQFFQYNPYNREFTVQKYATETMIKRRSQELVRAVNGPTKRLCFIFGALGRQGNTGVLDRLIKKIEAIFEYMVLIASQINVQLLTSIDVDFFVQIACPRLSIDWSYGTPKPLLTPYQLYALVDKYDLNQGYKMDYYSYQGGPWSNFYGKAPVKKGKVIKNEPRVKLQFQNVQ